MIATAPPATWAPAPLDQAIANLTDGQIAEGKASIGLLIDRDAVDGPAYELISLVYQHLTFERVLRRGRRR